MVSNMNETRHSPQHSRRHARLQFALVLSMPLLALVTGVALAAMRYGLR